MRKINLGPTDLQVSDTALGVMRMDQKSVPEATEIIEKAFMKGIDFFDTADIYGDGKSSTVLGDALASSSLNRDQYFLQSKGGIILENGQINGDGLKGPRYDFDAKHLIAAVDIELQRLHTDYLDSFLLHRPDTLQDPAEIAKAFDQLEKAGKVRHFGVSNMNPWQVEFLQSALNQKLIANQLQFGIMHTGMIDAELHVNMQDPRSVDHDGGILAYSRLNQMTIQAWSPFQYGFFEGPFIDNPKFPEINAKLQEIADKNNTSKNAVAVAWITYHPANMQVILGSMNINRIDEMTDADQVHLTNQEWYDIYFAAGNDLP
ncbi:aldo/keto reductase [Weissella koreensis]|uniref:Aldo/keto reductase n=1 Tax=Weissella koreensis TaxID=165096 RepID=A0A7H1MM85_9LACO|nr:aldo/keto reductase [Weissella koreensis]EJF34870.1 aldo/keto reductase [Weissella koreensis KCTC 3621]QGN20592.1 aldo/keto reductase [Weissella koreensis]QNT64571.1 aldo/keto reductase [Weissella koreensis]